MSTIAAVRDALETALASMTPPLATAFENIGYQPVVGTPYQAVNLLAAQPNNLEMGPGYHEQGILQVSLYYPKDGGPKDAQDRVELIRAKFARGASFVAGGVTTTIPLTPEVAPARIDDDRYVIPVKIRFQARIAS